MMMSMAGFVLNDTLMKVVMNELPLFQSMLFRGIFATALMAGLCQYMGAMKVEGGAIVALRHPMIVWRTIGEAGGAFFFLTALFNMPIANVTAVLQILPLTITLSAALFLGEAVGWKRYLAIIIGFCGVLLIVKPGTDGFDVFAIYALIATFFITLRDIATRRLPENVPSLLVSLLTAVVVTLMGLIGSLFETWQSLELIHVILLFGAAAILMVGYVCSILAMRNGEVSFIAPFRYSILIWALLLGYFVFGDVPDFWSIIGSMIVVGCGLFTFYRERKLAAR